MKPARLPRAVAGAVMLLVMLGGCAADGNAAVAPAGGADTASVEPTTTAPQPSGPAMGGPRLPVGATPVAGSRVDANALPPDYPRLVWTMGDGSELGLYGYAGACTTVSATATEQTDARVVITILERTNTSTICPHHVLNRVLTVTLAKPLADREVVLQRVVSQD